MFRATDEAGVHAEGVCNGGEAFEDVGWRGVEPCMEALATRPEDGGKLPVHALPQPADDGKAIENVGAEFSRRCRLDAVESIKVEDSEGGCTNVVGGAGSCARLPDCGRGHRTDAVGGSKPFCAGLPVHAVLAPAAVMDFAGPEQRIGRKDAGEEIGWIGGYEIAVDPLRGIVPGVGGIPRMALDECPPVGSGSEIETLAILSVALFTNTALDPFTSIT